jgi:hypothetical protein
MTQLRPITSQPQTCKITELGAVKHRRQYGQDRRLVEKLNDINLAWRTMFRNGAILVA